jgi:hypothetical protein
VLLLLDFRLPGPYTARSRGGAVGWVHELDAPAPVLAKTGGILCIENSSLWLECLSFLR